MAAPTVLHDTSSISEYIENGHAVSAAEYLRSPHVPAISFQTKAELTLWALKPSSSQHIRDGIHDFLATATILQSDSRINRLFAEIMHARMLAYPNRGWRDLDVGDAWIGATAAVHGLLLITYDQRGFNDVPGLDSRVLIY